MSSDKLLINFDKNKQLFQSNNMLTNVEIFDAKPFEYWEEENEDITNDR